MQHSKRPVQHTHSRVCGNRVVSRWISININLIRWVNIRYMAGGGSGDSGAGGGGVNVKLFNSLYALIG